MNRVWILTQPQLCARSAPSVQNVSPGSTGVRSRIATGYISLRGGSKGIYRRFIVSLPIFIMCIVMILFDYSRLYPAFVDISCC